MLKQLVHFLFVLPKKIKMFRRKTSKLDAEQLKPPTKKEILEDLQTFVVEPFISEKERRRLSNIDTTLIDLQKSGKSSGAETEENRELNQWWLKFEKFLGDIDDLENFHKQFDIKKTTLAKVDKTIGIMADEIQTRVSDSLQKALDEVADGEQDLR